MHGLTTATRDVEHARRIGEELEAGSVWINGHMGIIPTAHFGGHKASRIGGGLRGRWLERVLQYADILCELIDIK